MSTTDFAGDFGANEWLVDEMYEKYLANPDSVDSQWKAFFADSGARNGSAPVVGAPSAAATGAASSTPPVARTSSTAEPTHHIQLPPGVTLPAAGGRPPAPKSASNNSNGALNGNSASAPSVNGAATPVTPAASITPNTPAASVTPTSPVTPAAQSQSVISKAPRTTTPLPAQPIQKSAPVVESPSSGQVDPLRGTAARVVTNMEASLHVPTATSVRDRKSTRLNSSHSQQSRMPSSA